MWPSVVEFGNCLFHISDIIYRQVLRSRPCLQCFDTVGWLACKILSVVVVVICLEQGADCLYMVQLMPLHSNTLSSLALFLIQTGFTFLVLA